MNFIKFYAVLFLFLSKEIFACNINVALSSGVGGRVSVSGNDIIFDGKDGMLSLIFIDKETQSLMASFHGRKDITNFEEFFDAICDSWVKSSCSKNKFGSVDFIEISDKKIKTTIVPNLRDSILVGYVMKSGSIDGSVNCEENESDYVITALDIFFKTGDLVDVTNFLKTSEAAK